MMMDAAEIWSRVKRKTGKNRAEMNAEEVKHESGSHNGGQAESQTETKKEARNEGKGEEAAEVKTAEGQPNPETEPNGKEEKLSKDI
jgi:hypothetical protein